jgi:hypothetical protein
LSSKIKIFEAEKALQEIKLDENSPSRTTSVAEKCYFCQEQKTGLAWVVYKPVVDPDL